MFQLRAQLLAAVAGVGAPIFVTQHRSDCEDAFVRREIAWRAEVEEQPRGRQAIRGEFACCRSEAAGDNVHRW